VLDEAVGRLAEDDLPGRGGLLEPLADVDRVAADEAVAGGRIAGHHLAGVDPDPHLEVDLARAIELRDALLDVERGSHGPQGIVLVDDRHAEDGHDLVADELLDGAAMRLDDRRGTFEEAEHQVAERLRVEPARELGERDEVAEEDSDRLAPFDGAIREHVHVPNVHPSWRVGQVRAYHLTVLSEGVTGLAVEVLDLVKRYPKAQVNAVDGVSFGVAGGEVFGLLGPNGAGKTTTVGMLTTRVRPTAGTARIGGVDVAEDPVQARRQLAVVPQRSNLDRSISIRDNLVFHAAYHGVPARERERRADELLEQFGLLDRARDKPDFFSGGQAQRVMIARALTHAPRVLFLDEPTTGLDPAARLFVWDRLRELRDSEVTLILTTHDMDEAALLADRVGIMDHGKLLALDTPEALMRSLEGEGTLELAADKPADGTVVDALGALRGVDRIEQVQAVAENSAPPARDSQPLRVRLYLSGDAALLVAPAAAVLAEHGLALQDVKLGAPTLEDVFIHLTGRALR
jgi:ABC-2 type transport system ATP-binding protein